MQGLIVGSICRVPTQNQALSPVKCLLQYASHCTTGQRANAGNRTRKMHEDPAQRLVVSDFMQGQSESAKAAISVVQNGGWGGDVNPWVPIPEFWDSGAQWNWNSTSFLPAF